MLHRVQPGTVGFASDGLDRIDALMRSELGSVFPAAALLVARSGGVVMHEAYGFLDPETQERPTDTDCLFDLASVTKLFTATTFMSLVEEGRVSLDTPVAEVLPEFGGVRPISAAEDPISKTPVPVDARFSGVDVDARQVTFWHLLTHTSGLASWRSLYRENGDADTPLLPHQVTPELRQRRIAAIHQRYGFVYPPGQQMVYSDLGLILLGEATARLYNDDLEAAVQERVLQPLALGRACYNPLGKNTPLDSIVPTEFCAWRNRRCVGEVHDENAASLGGVAGHAGLFATVWDMAVLGQTYLNQGRYGETQILSPASVGDMIRTHVNFDDNPRGLGWLQRSQRASSSGSRFGPRSYGHTGFTGTSLWVDPDRELVVSLLTNRVYYGRDPDGIVRFRPRLHDAVVEAMGS
jgi:CubicO group peptidase (beta-lactamase class C family)